MTPEERNLVTELFDRLAKLEDGPRDREAERLIQDGLRQAPNALYALVQTVLVQEAAIKSADTRIRALEAERGAAAEPERRGGFLDSGRNSPWVSAEAPRPGSVPTVRPAGAPVRSEYRAEAQPTSAEPSAPPSGGAGGSFLGTAAAAAIGMIGGSLLSSGIRSMMGHQGGTAHAAADPARGGSLPWGNIGSSGGDLARQAGIDDIGRGTGGRGEAGGSRGLFDSDPASAVPSDGNDDANYAETDEDLGDLGDDSGGDDQ